MKRINELTESELLELTDEQISNMVDYECAVEGVPMLPPHPGPAPFVEKCKPDIDIYTVGGVYCATAEDAARILDAIANATTIFKTDGYSDDKRYIAIPPGDYYYPKVEIEKGISATAYAAWKDQNAGLKELIGAYKEQRSTYDDAYKSREEIVQRVNNFISDARRNSYTRDCLRADFARYMELAEGNRRIALNFLEKVKDLSDFPELKEEFCPDMPEVASAA